MNRNFTYTLFAICGIAVFIISGMQMEGKPDGAPSGSTGSPGDGATCAQEDCHTGTAKPMDGLIFSNIPETGYLSGETYTITVTVSNPGGEKFGFQASPQNLDGDKMGQMIRTDEIQTKFVGFQKYITHTLAGNSGTDSKTWTFDWTPTTSEGDVTFYVAVNAANNDDEATGDSIYTNALTVMEDPENMPLSVEQYLFNALVLVNNPVQDILQLHLSAFSDAGVIIRIYNLDGQIVTESNLYSRSTAEVSVQHLKPGIYLVQCSDGNKIFTGRFVKL